MLRKLVVTLVFMLALVGVNFNIVNDVHQSDISYNHQVVEVADTSSIDLADEIQDQEVVVEVATTLNISFEESNIQVVSQKAHTSREIVAKAHAPPTIAISLGSTAEARDRFFRDLSREADRTVDRVRDRIINDTQRNIERRIDDHIRDQSELLDPNSRTYQEYKCKNIINSLPYGYTRILVQGSVDAYNAPGCVFIERHTVRLFERMLAKYSNIVIVNDCYKMGRNGRYGDWIGFDIRKVENVNDIIVTR